MALTKKAIAKANRKCEKGFTLIELLIVIAIIGILAGVAIPLFSSFRVKAYNTTVKADLKNTMTFLEAYYTDYNTFPNTSADLLATGFILSKDVSFTRYDVESMPNGEPTVQMHIDHAASPNYWQANYPQEGFEIEKRDK